MCVCTGVNDVLQYALTNTDPQQLASLLTPLVEALLGHNMTQRLNTAQQNRQPSLGRRLSQFTKPPLSQPAAQQQPQPQPAAQPGSQPAVPLVGKAVGSGGGVVPPLLADLIGNGGRLAGAPADVAAQLTKALQDGGMDAASAQQVCVCVCACVCVCVSAPALVSQLAR